MRTIQRTRKFKRDLNRVRAGRYGKDLETILREALGLLIDDRELPDRYCDHALTGEWNDYRDCHLKPDLILIYQKRSSDILELVRLGTHSELGL
jgi:mRNA interferase YafQ